MKRIFEVVIYIIGLNCIGLGISLSVNSGLGGSTWDAFSYTLAHLTNLSPGDVVFFLGVVLTIVINVINYKYITKLTPLFMVVTIFSGYVVGISIDFWEPVVEHFLLLFPISPILGFMLGMIGITITGFGIALYSRTSFPVDPIDNFMVQLHKHQNYSLTTSRYITDLIALVLTVVLIGYAFVVSGVLTSDYIGFGNIIVFVALSPIIGFFAVKLRFVKNYFN